MTREERHKHRARLRKNLEDHLDLDANTELPETHDLRFARNLIYTLAAALIAVLAWSANTEVSEVVSGRGVIKTEVQMERLEHPSGGQVRTIDVAAGAKIEQGTRVMTFETDTLVREREKQYAALSALETEHARIDFVLDGRLPADLDEASLSQTPEGLIFWAEQRYLEAQLEQIRASRETIAATLASLSSQKGNLIEELDLLRDRLVRSQRALASGALSKIEVEQRMREVLQVERNLITLDTDMSAQNAALHGTELETAELMARRRREAALRLGELQSSIANTRLSIAELDDRIESADVVATVTGTVLSLAASHSGEVIDPGEVIAEIVPENTTVKGELEIAASKIGGVHVGMLVRVKVDTFDFTRFGELAATVLEISPTSFENQEGETVYNVTVSFDAGADVPRIGGQLLRPGMTITADVITESKTVLTYLLKPLRLLKDRALTEA